MATDVGEARRFLGEGLGYQDLVTAAGFFPATFVQGDRNVLCRVIGGMFGQLQPKEIGLPERGFRPKPGETYILERVERRARSSVVRPVAGPFEGSGPETIARVTIPPRGRYGSSWNEREVLGTPEQKEAVYDAALQKMLRPGILEVAAGIKRLLEENGLAWRVELRPATAGPDAGYLVVYVWVPRRMDGEPEPHTVRLWKDDAGNIDFQQTVERWGDWNLPEVE